MSCNFKKCVFVPRSSFTSSLLKVLVTLKLLHGGRLGSKGSTLEDIAMHMIKHFCLDGDIKSQVLASLKYGVKMHFIQKRKEKFSLILPASSIHLAPCKFKNEEIERIQCIFPAAWYSSACSDPCSQTSQSCCGKRKRSVGSVCCQESGDEESEDTGGTYAQRRSNSVCRQGSPTPSNRSQGSCPKCFPPSPKKSRRSPPPCPKPKPSVCGRSRSKKGPPKSLYDDYCQLCPGGDDDDDDDECGSRFQHNTYKNCSCCEN